MGYRLLLVAPMIGSLAPGFASAHAQAATDFKGKSVTVIIAFGIGGGHDQYARLFARHVGRHIPGNPTVVPSNIPGANGLVAANERPQVQLDLAYRLDMYTWQRVPAERERAQVMAK